MEPINTPRRNRAIVWLSAAAIAAGLGVGAASIASAASATDATSNTTAATTPASSDTTGTTGTVAATPPARVDPASLPNGPGETLLTGDTAAKVTAAALAAEPGSTIVRVETDSGGHAYEAHVKLADGTFKTLYFNSSFAADGSDTGFGGPQGGHGQPPVGQDTAGRPPLGQDTATTTG